MYANTRVQMAFPNVSPAAFVVLFRHDCRYVARLQFDTEVF